MMFATAMGQWQRMGGFLVGRFCMNCSTELSEDDKFCQSCGQKVFDIADIQEAQQAQQVNIVPAALTEDKVIHIEDSANSTVENQYEYSDTTFDKPVVGAPQKRNIWQKWILSIVTLGIYNFVWEYFFVRDLKKMAGDNAIMNYVPALLLTVVTLGLYNVYYIYRMGIVVSMIEDIYHVPEPKENFNKYMAISVVLGIIGIVIQPLLMVSMIVFLVFEYKMVAAFNRAVDYYGRG